MSHVSGNMGGIPFGNSSRMEETSDVKKTEEAVIPQPSSGRLGRRSIGRGPLDQVMQKAIVGGALGQTIQDIHQNIGQSVRQTHQDVHRQIQDINRQIQENINDFFQNVREDAQRVMYQGMINLSKRHRVVINFVQMHKEVTEALESGGDISKVRQHFREKIENEHPEIKQEAVDEIMEAFDGVVVAVFDQMQSQANKNKVSDGRQSSSSSSSSMQQAVNLNGSKKTTDDMAITDDTQKRVEEKLGKLDKESLDLKKEFLGEEDKNRKKEQMKNNTKE